MKIASAVVASMLAMCGSVFGVTTAHVLDATPIDGGVGFVSRANNSVAFSALTGPFVGFAAATGILGFDDYNTGVAGATMRVQSLRFVGGVSVAGGQVRFEFFNSAAVLVNSATVTLPSAGNFNWNIGFESVANAKDSLFQVPTNGFFQVRALGAATGQWFLATAAPTIGTESRASGQGSLTTHSHRFELVIPAPGAAALLGLSGLVAIRRRR